MSTRKRREKKRREKKRKKDARGGVRIRPNTSSVGVIKEGPRCTYHVELGLARRVVQERRHAAPPDAELPRDGHSLRVERRIPRKSGTETAAAVGQRRQHSNLRGGATAAISYLHRLLLLLLRRRRRQQRRLSIIATTTSRRPYCR